MEQLNPDLNPAQRDLLQQLVSGAGQSPSRAAAPGPRAPEGPRSPEGPFPETGGMCWQTQMQVVDLSQLCRCKQADACACSRHHLLCNQACVYNVCYVMLSGVSLSMVPWHVRVINSSARCMLRARARDHPPSWHVVIITS